MARARNIKPGLFKNELLGVADPHITILFASLWCLADKAGRLEDRPLRIKAETFPYREGLDINGYLTVLARMGFIHRYEANGVALIQVAEFAKHQAPHHTEKDSVLPAFDPNTMILKDTGVLTVKPALNDRGLTQAKRSDSLIPDSLIPDSGLTDLGFQIPEKGIVERRDAPLDHDPVPDIFAYWQKTMDSPRSVLDAKRITQIRKALKIGYTPRQLCEAIKGCSMIPHNMGTDPQGNGTKYNSIELIFRDADHIDRFIAAASAVIRKGGKESMEDHNERIMREVLGDSPEQPPPDGMTIEMEA